MRPDSTGGGRTVGGVEWVVRWTVTVNYDRCTPHPRWRYQRVTEVTTAELRPLLAECRADPRVTRYGKQRVWRLIGDHPTHCPHGHDLGEVDSRVELRSRTQWHACDCIYEASGHLLITCGTCGAVLADPPLARGCRRPGVPLPAAGEQR
jgi:hypothetical protein